MSGTSTLAPLGDRVCELTSISGTGPIPLSGALNTCVTFASVYSTTTTPIPVAVVDELNGLWMEAAVTYDAVNNQLDIQSVYSSSNDGRVVTFKGNPNTRVFVVTPGAILSQLIAGAVPASNISLSKGILTMTGLDGSITKFTGTVETQITGVNLSANQFPSTDVVGTTIATLTATETGTPGTPTFALAVDPTNGGLSISGSSLNLAASVSPGTYTAQITVTDPIASNSPQTYPVTLTCVEGTSISDIAITTTSINAGQSGAVGGTLSVTGVGNPTATFALSGTNAADFTINSSDQIVAAQSLVAGNYPLTVTATPVSPNLPNPTPATGQNMTVIGSGPDMFVLEVTQDYYQENAQFSVQIGNGPTTNLTGSAQSGSSIPDIFVFRGTYGAGSLTFYVSDLNYNNSGTATAPSNLRTVNVISLSYNGQPFASNSIIGIFEGQYLLGSDNATVGFQTNPTTFTKTITLVAASASQISAIVCSNTNFPSSDTAGAVIGTLSVQGTGLSGTATFSINPAQSPNFTVKNGNQLVLVNQLGAGTYQPFITATLAGAGNSPFTQQISVTCYAATSAQEIVGLTLTDINGNPLTQVEAGTAQYTQLGVLQAAGSAGPLKDPITYAISSQSGPVSNAFTVTNYRELLVNSTTLPAGTYNVTISVTCAAGANSPQTYPFTITVAAGGTITLNPVVSSLVRGEQLLLSGTYTGLPPQFIGYALNGSPTYVPCYNLVLDSPNVGDWSAIAPAPTLVETANTIKVCKGTTGITSAASNTFATTDYDTSNTFRLFFTPHNVAASGSAPFYSQLVGNFYFSGGVGPYTVAASVNNGGTYFVGGNNGLGIVAKVPGNRLAGGVNPTLTLTATDSTGTQVSHNYTLFLTPFATFALTQNTFFNNNNHQNYTPLLFCMQQNPLNSDQASSISDTSNGPNYTTQWNMGNGIWGGGFYGSISSYGKTLGDYPISTIATTSSGNFTVLANFLMVLLDNIAPFNIKFTPIGTFSSAAPNGWVIGKLDAGSMDNATTYSFVSPNASLIVNGKTGNLTVISPLPAGSFSFTPTAYNSSNASTSSSLTITVPTGTVLPSSNMTAVVATNLNNYPISAYGSSGPGTGGFNGLLPTPFTVITPTVTGITGTITWLLQQNNVAAYISDATGTWQLGYYGQEVISYRYRISTTTGIVEAISYMSAETDPLTITAFDGTNSCTQTFNVVVAGVQGPTLHCGQGMSTTYGSSGYEYMTPIRSYFSGAYGNPIFSGQTILVYPNSLIDYYSDDNGNGPAGTPKNDGGGGGNARHGINGPCTWEGVTGGAMTRVGGFYGNLGFNGLGADGKAFFNVSGGDQVYENFAINYVRAWQWGGAYNQCAGGYSGAGIQFNGQTFGNGTVNNCYFDECDMGIHSADSNQSLTLSNLYACNCGCTWNGSGPMHNFYIGAGWQMTVSNVLSIRTFNGHEFKNRMQNSTISNCRFGDTERGQASVQLHLANGGAHTVMNSVFHKGTQCQNPYSIEFADDMQYYTDIQSFSVDSSGNTLISNSFKNFGTSGIWAVGRTSSTTGKYTTVTSTNDSFFGYNLNIGGSWETQPTYTTTGISQPFPVPITSKGAVTLTSQPSLNLTTPITPAITTRPSPISLPYDGDGEQQYAGELYLGGGATQGIPSGLGQIDPGSDDVHVSASASPVGTTLFTMSAKGVPYFSNNPTQPDIRIDPYGSGTTWSLINNPHAYVDGSFPLAPAGQFLINSTSGAVSVGQTLTAGTTYIICPQAQASATNGGYFVWDMIYIVVGT